MAFWKRIGSGRLKPRKGDQDPGDPNQVDGISVEEPKTFSRAVAGDIADDSLTLEIYRGEPEGTVEMAVAILWDEKYEVIPPPGDRMYSASEVAEILELVVPFAIETVKGNIIDRVAYPEYHKEEYREKSE